MTAATEQQHECLNCGEPLTGHFCANCGQRDIPAYPTVRNVLSDAWDDFSGWDGRLVRTVRALVSRPGELAKAAAEGRRVRHVRPLRVYLTASLIYFFVGAYAPAVTNRQATVPGERDVKINLSEIREGFALTPEEKAQVLKNMEDAPAFLKPLLLAIVEDPAGFRQRTLEIMPRVFFALVPIFAGILALFYRGRHFPAHLIFALHLHAFVFLVLTMGELAKFTRSLAVVAPVQIAAWIAIFWYGFRALRRMYGESRLRTIAKAAGLGFAYLMIWIPALAAVMAWATLTR